MSMIWIRRSRRAVQKGFGGAPGLCIMIEDHMKVCLHLCACALIVSIVHATRWPEALPTMSATSGGGGWWGGVHHTYAVHRMILDGCFLEKKSHFGSISLLQNVPCWRRSAAPERLLIDMAWGLANGRFLELWCLMMTEPNWSYRQQGVSKVRIIPTVYGPGPDDPCALCWYRPLCVQKLTLSVFNDVKSPEQYFHVRHFLD